MYNTSVYNYNYTQDYTPNQTSISFSGSMITSFPINTYSGRW